MVANEIRRKNYHNALLGYILKWGLGQIRTVIFLNRWLESRGLRKSIQSHMVSYCSEIKCVRSFVCFLSVCQSMGIQMGKKQTNEQTELHQFRKEPSYDDELSPCQV